MIIGLFVVLIDVDGFLVFCDTLLLFVLYGLHCDAMGLLVWITLVDWFVSLFAVCIDLVFGF